MITISNNPSFRMVLSGIESRTINHYIIIEYKKGLFLYVIK